MYPFKGNQPFVKNRWYIAGFTDEIGREPLGRTILDVPLVLYRTQAGVPVALYGLCPHRYFPLAKGRVEGDAVVCGYHGFTFEADGKCSAIPSQGTAAGFCQPTWSILERGPLCWIWMGDADRADPALIPPYEDFGLGEDGWRYSSPNHFVIKGRAQLLIDNLMDLTHLPYLHWHVPGGEAMKAIGSGTSLTCWRTIASAAATLRWQCRSTTRCLPRWATGIGARSGPQAASSFPSLTLRPPASVQSGGGPSPPGRLP